MANQLIEELEKKKRFLRGYRKNLACLNRLKTKLRLLDMRITSVRSPDMSGMPRGSAPVTLDDLLADKEELEIRIKELSKKSKSLKRKILAEIDALEDDRYIEILESYFIDGLTLESIADNMGYSERYLYDLYKKALVKLTINNS